MIILKVIHISTTKEHNFFLLIQAFSKSNIHEIKISIFKKDIDLVIT